MLCSSTPSWTASFPTMLLTALSTSWLAVTAGAGTEMCRSGIEVREGGSWGLSSRKHRSSVCSHLWILSECLPVRTREPITAEVCWRKRKRADTNLSLGAGPVCPSVAVSPEGFGGSAPAFPDSGWLSVGLWDTSLEGMTPRPLLHWPET